MSAMIAVIAITVVTSRAAQVLSVRIAKSATPAVTGADVMYQAVVALSAGTARNA